MSGPARIQRRRTKGWRKPEGAVIVTRGSEWGNPFPIGIGVVVINGTPTPTKFQPTARKIATRADAVAAYRSWIDGQDHAHIRRMLGGHDLCCWCPLDQPCHADVLLEIANRP